MKEFVSFSKNPALKKAAPEGKVLDIVRKLNDKEPSVTAAQEIPGSWSFDFNDDNVKKAFVIELGNAQIPWELRKGKVTVKTPDMKEHRIGRKRPLMEEANIYGSLTTFENKLKKFIAAADDPLSPMEDLTYEIADLVDAYQGGEVVRRGDIAGLSSTAGAINRAFAKTYGAFAEARDAAYNLAELVGADTKSSAPRSKPPELRGFSNTEILADIEKMAHEFKDGYRDVQEAGARTSQMVKKALDAMSSGSAEGDVTAQGRDIVKAFVEFRDLVGPRYYAMMGGVGRRVNELIDRFMRNPVMQKKGAEPKQEPEVRTEVWVEIPWENDPDLGLIEEERKMKVMSESWDDLVNKIEKAPHGKVPRGMDEATDFLAQVLNGGVQQYVQNGYGGDFNTALNFLQSTGGKGTELADLMDGLNPSPDGMSSKDADKMTKDPASWEKLEKWVYNNANLDAVSDVMIAKLPEEKAVAEEKEKDNDKEKDEKEPKAKKDSEKKDEPKKEKKAKKDDETGEEGEKDEMGIEIPAPIAVEPAPPVGVSTISPAPGLMKVERLVRKLKGQVLETL